MTKIFLNKGAEDLIRSLEKSTIAKVVRVIDLLEKFSYRLGLPHAKKIGTNLFELRVRGQQEVRLFYTFKKEIIIVLHGFIKKSEAIPKKEIEQANRKLKDLT